MTENEKLVQRNATVYPWQVEYVMQNGRSLGADDYSTALRMALNEWIALKRAGYGVLSHPDGAVPVPVVQVSTGGSFDAYQQIKAETWTD